MTMIPVDPLHQPGDLILVEFGPVRGTEQDGRRPALIVSEALMNAATRRVIIDRSSAISSPGQPRSCFRSVCLSAAQC
jgi:hypothetical protein